MKVFGLRHAVLAAVLVATAGQLATAAPFTYRTIALTGQPAPQLDGLTISSFVTMPYAITPGGQVLLGGALAGPGVTANTDAALWLIGPSGPQLLSREGDPAPGIAGATILNLGHTSINSAGQVLQEATLTGSGVTSANGYAIWLGTPGNWQLALRAGVPTPSGDTYPAPGAVMASQVNGPSLLDDGTMILPNAWSGQLGALAPRVRIGDPWVRDASFTASTVAITDITTNGTIGYAVTYRKPGIPPFGFDQYITALFEGSGAQPAIVYTQPDNAPGVTGPTAGISTLYFPMMASSGDWLVKGRMSGVANPSGLWAGPRATFTLLARQGDVAPDTGGLKFAQGFDSGTIVPVISRTGEAVFEQGPDNGTIKGLWAGTQGDLHRIAFVDDRASDGSTITAPAAAYQPAINPAGQVAFLLAASDTAGSTPGALALYDPDSGIHIVARVGQSFEVAPGDFRQISSVAFRGGSGDYGTPSGLSDGGDLVYYLTFTDGTSGVFEATIPEPASASLLALASLLLLRRRC